jgi:hypothetical protein
VNPKPRKLLLATHIVVSVGWIGAVQAYLILVIAAMTSWSDQLLPATWVALRLIGWYVIVPLALAALITGFAISLSTSWGLFRHYWVLISLHLTVVAIAILLWHLSSVVTPLGIISVDAANADVRDVLRPALRGELLHAGLGLVVLLGIAILNVYKPRGLTPYGRRLSELGSEAPTRIHQWVRVMGFHAAALLLLVIIIAHVVAGGGLQLHN